MSKAAFMVYTFSIENVCRYIDFLRQSKNRKKNSILNPIKITMQNYDYVCVLL